jgi:hypothetical protein
MIVTLLCNHCSNYFRIEAFEPEDERNRICESCEESHVRAEEAAWEATQDACTHEHIKTIYIDDGRCERTGYREDGHFYECEECGLEMTAAEVLAARKPVQSELVGAAWVLQQLSGTFGGGR